MSLRLRVRYQVRSIARFLFSFSVPSFLTGNTARLTVSTVALFLLVGYVSKISHLSTSGYEIDVLEKKVAVLSDESVKLNAEVASYQSIASIQKRLQGASMVPVKNINYIKTSATVVAER